MPGFNRQIAKRQHRDRRSVCHAVALRLDRMTLLSRLAGVDGDLRTAAWPRCPRLRHQAHRFVHSHGFPRWGQIEHGAERKPTTLVFTDRLCAISKLHKGRYQAAYGALMRRLEVDKLARSSCPQLWCRIFFDQPVELLLQSGSQAILELN